MSEIRKCKDCEHFKIIEQPEIYDWGRAECKKHELIVEFKNKRMINRLTCVEDRPKEHVAAAWGDDYDMHMDKIYKRPVCGKCKYPFGQDEQGVERCYNCGRIVDVTDPEMVEWLKVRRETKTEMGDCFQCGGKGCMEFHMRRNPITLEWQGAFGHCNNCGMQWIS